MPHSRRTPDPFAPRTPVDPPARSRSAETPQTPSQPQADASEAVGQSTIPARGSPLIGRCRRLKGFASTQWTTGASTTTVPSRLGGIAATGITPSWVYNFPRMPARDRHVDQHLLPLRRRGLRRTRRTPPRPGRGRPGTHRPDGESRWTGILDTPVLRATTSWERIELGPATLASGEVVEPARANAGDSTKALRMLYFVRFGFAIVWAVLMMADRFISAPARRGRRTVRPGGEGSRRPA